MSISSSVGAPCPVPSVLGEGSGSSSDSAQFLVRVTTSHALSSGDSDDSLATLALTTFDSGNYSELI